jgi:hypothetical protein
MQSLHDLCWGQPCHLHLHTWDLPAGIQAQPAACCSSGVSYCLRALICTTTVGARCAVDARHQGNKGEHP